jgi:hypothetical protein
VSASSNLALDGDNSDGIFYNRCGHYVPTHFYDTRDCGKRFCALSSRHDPNCRPPHCECDFNWDPDHGQTIIARSAEACSNCFDYFASAPSANAR